MWQSAKKSYCCRCSATPFIKKFENAQTETYTKAYAAVLQIFQDRYRQIVSDAVATETADQKEERLARCLQVWLDEDEVLLPSKKKTVMKRPKFNLGCLRVV